MLKAPPLQTATATIDTLCGRLQSATLLEDRRAAILGLRSFAKQYPASVASGSLRELITTLKRDGLGEDTAKRGTRDGVSQLPQEGGDVDTIRLVLETLLMLFNPDASSPEAGDEIAFFMADEFSMVCRLGYTCFLQTTLGAGAKLILAPRQRDAVDLPVEPNQSICGLLHPTVLHPTTFRHQRCATRKTSGMYPGCTARHLAPGRRSRRCSRCGAQRWSSAPGRIEYRCERGLA